jgi:hypothetical protein
VWHNSSGERNATNNMENKKSTKTIAGRQVTLTAGRIYRASRPMASSDRRRNSEFPITIQIIDYKEGGIRSAKIRGLNYDQANDFLDAFNNGPTSFDGRTWS